MAAESKPLSHEKPIAKWIRLVSLLVIIALACMTIYIVATWGHGSWDARVNWVLKLIGFYGTGFGLLKASKRLSQFDDLLENMTSADPLHFIVGNASFLTWPFLILAEVFGRLPANTPRVLRLSQALLGLLTLLLTPVGIVRLLFYIFVMLPLGYIAFAIATAFVRLIENSVDESTVSVVDTNTGTQLDTLAVKELVTGNPTAAKGFIIGLPALFLGLMTDAIKLFIAN